MSDLLAIAGAPDAHGQLLEEIVRSRPDRVTVLLEDEDAGLAWGSDQTEHGQRIRDRLAALLAAIERETGAVVVGLAGSPDQLLGWRFDRVVRTRVTLAA